MKNSITIKDIESARQRLPDYIRTTPVNESLELSKLTGVPVRLKLEHQQITNSFKIRGASNAVALLTEQQKSAGVVCVSTGNHGRGIAFASKRAGVKATVFMSDLVPDNKINGIRDLDAEIIIAGSSQDDAEQAAIDHIKQTGAIYLPPFDHKDIISGQGTLGLEIIEQYPEVETVIVPLSGGGLISGIALAIKALRPECSVYGVTMNKGAAMVESLKAGRPVPVQELSTFADSLGGGIGLDNQYTFNILKNLLDDTSLVSESQIADAIRHSYLHERQVIEGGASVGIAALLANKIKLSGPSVVVLSGCNINMDVHKAILDGANDLSEI